MRTYPRPILDLRRAKRSGAKFRGAKLSGIVAELSLPRSVEAAEPTMDTLPSAAAEPGPEHETLPKASEVDVDPIEVQARMPPDRESKEEGADRPPASLRR